MIQYDNYTPPTNPSNPENTGDTGDNSDKIAFDPNDPGAPGRYGDQSIPNPNKTDTPSTPVTQPSTDSSDDSTLANGKPATVENVLAIIAEFKQKYPEGTTWTTGKNGIGGTQRPGLASDACNKIGKSYINIHGTTNSMQGGCGGFASLISDTVFGSGSKNPARKVSPSQTRPGDIIMQLDKNGVLFHVTTASSNPVWFEEAIWHSETDTYTGMYYVENYDGGGDQSTGGGVVSTIPYCYLPETYSESCGYYVEVWTRYPD